VEHNSGVRPTDAFVDKGYRGHGCRGDTQIHIVGASNKDASRTLRKRRRRRSAIEPLIGHMKSDHRMGRCFLKGLLGDAINAVLAAAGRNFRKLLRCVFALIFDLVRAAKGWKLPSWRDHWLATTA
jgi:IS5 family transposase